MPENEGKPHATSECEVCDGTERNPTLVESIKLV